MTDQTAPAHKPDNLLGICHALGEDLGFNPLWLRIALAAAFMFAPLQVIAGYFVAGAVVLATRLISPNPKIRRSADVTPLPERAAPVEAVELPKAA